MKGEGRGGQPQSKILATALHEDGVYAFFLLIDFAQVFLGLLARLESRVLMDRLALPETSDCQVLSAWPAIWDSLDLQEHPGSRGIQVTQVTMEPLEWMG